MTRPGTSEAGGAAAPEHTVLIVDDSVIDRHLAGAIVQKLEGWKATFAGNGVEALQLLKSGALPDLVLTDMLMPEMDGLELVQAIRNQYPLLPVILMTAHGSEDIAIQALQARGRQLRTQEEPGPRPARDHGSDAHAGADQHQEAADPRKPVPARD